jgi:hypothetical protein
MFSTRICGEFVWSPVAGDAFEANQRKAAPVGMTANTYRLEDRRTQAGTLAIAQDSRIGRTRVSNSHFAQECGSVAAGPRSAISLIGDEATSERLAALASDYEDKQCLGFRQAGADDALRANHVVPVEISTQPFWRGGHVDPVRELR